MSSSPLMLGPRVSASPIWIRLLDTFTGEAPQGRVAVSIERRIGSDWVAFEQEHQLSSYGDLAFVNLGRTHDPVAAGSFDVRVTVTAKGMITEAPGGSATLTTTVASWSPNAPGVPPQPDHLHLFPGPGYPFPAGIRSLTGRVVDVDGHPASRARVWASATVQNSLLTEEVRSDGDGRFRLPLRWSAGATQIHASRGAAAGSIAVTVPADLSSTHQITLS